MGLLSLTCDNAKILILVVDEVLRYILNCDYTSRCQSLHVVRLDGALQPSAGYSRTCAGDVLYTFAGHVIVGTQGVNGV
jgi:hypothetical protein